jgi:3-oxoacyl-(acyl-carrier-protein) synthase
MRRVAVTGMGVVSPLGNTAAEVFSRCYNGHSGVRVLDTPFAHRLGSPIAGVAAFDGAAHFDAPKLRMLDRVSQMALVAAQQAIADARFDARFDTLLDGPLRDPDCTGVFMGCGMGGIQSNDEGFQSLYGENSDRIKPFTVLMGMHNAPAAWVAMAHGVRGPSLTYSTACSSSAIAIGEAWLRVASGTLDVALAGGAEAPLSFGSMKAWEALHTVAKTDLHMAPTSCKPFSKNRSGMVLGEGAALLVLEAWDAAVARGAAIHGEILGYGVCTDPSHITKPSAQGQALAMQAALRSAGLHAQEVDAINAHGTGTLANDVAETQAIKAVFGARARHIPVSATKALHGHLLGAAGVLECVISFLAMQRDVLMPTMHLDEPDPQCDLDYVANGARPSFPTRTMLSNSFAFGGSNAVLALRATQCRQRVPRALLL